MCRQDQLPRALAMGVIEYDKGSRKNALIAAV
jgi:hypothetical protein